MTRLTVYPDTDPATVLLDTRDGDRIADTLTEIGVVFERWAAPHALGADADQEAVLAAYDVEVSKLMEEGGYQSVDVARVKPDNPQAGDLRKKFLAEHTHDDDEVRFFVDGAVSTQVNTDSTAPKAALNKIQLRILEIYEDLLLSF